MAVGGLLVACGVVIGVCFGLGLFNGKTGGEYSFLKDNFFFPILITRGRAFVKDVLVMIHFL